MRCAIKTCCSTPAIKHILISYLLFAFGRLKDRIAKMRRINCVCPCPQTTDIVEFCVNSSCVAYDKSINPDVCELRFCLRSCCFLLLLLFDSTIYLLLCNENGGMAFHSMMSAFFNAYQELNG
jgi:hypothetical protein